MRFVSRFSAGAASAVATKLALADHPELVIHRAWLADEHPDNDRFCDECKAWFGAPIATISALKDRASPLENFRRRGFIKNRFGTQCSIDMKRNVLEAIGLPDDVWVLGFTAEEQDRLDRLIDANNGRKIICPLIERRLTKADCLAMLERAGIALPIMYRMGYNNNNCICCPKGGEGYFNRQRVDFPEQFEALCQIQDAIGPTSYLFRNRKTGVRFSLRDLPPTSGRHKEPDISCSAFCMMAEEDFAERPDSPETP